MTIELVIDNNDFRLLVNHLTGGPEAIEEAAFLFCSFENRGTDLRILHRHIQLLGPDDFTSRSAYYLELKDEVRSGLIKRAHDLGACLVEFHSHPKQLHAEFSWSDLDGFEDFVPHVRWRLKGRPYIAVVWGMNTFDSLAWAENSPVPSGYATISVGDNRFHPTGNTFSQLEKSNERRPL